MGVAIGVGNGCGHCCKEIGKMDVAICVGKGGEMGVAIGVGKWGKMDVAIGVAKVRNGCGLGLSTSCQKCSRKLLK